MFVRYGIYGRLQWFRLQWDPIQMRTSSISHNFYTNKLQYTHTFDKQTYKFLQLVQYYVFKPKYLMFVRYGIYGRLQWFRLQWDPIQMRTSSIGAVSPPGRRLVLHVFLHKQVTIYTHI